MAAARSDERIFWALLATVSQIGPARFGRLIDHFNSTTAPESGGLKDAVEKALAELL